ncbi:MAG: hypothetical protein LBI82_11835 [Dysgonamonadaceae bacterium]|jgi:hypothetical protein|nr:hypothetical protein [Dysgonamonadaceae bacterium]
MKKIVLILAVLIMSFGAFAQQYQIAIDFADDAEGTEYPAFRFNGGGSLGVLEAGVATVVANPVGAGNCVQFTVSNWDQAIKVATVEIPASVNATLGNFASISVDGLSAAVEYKEALVRLSAPVEITTDPTPIFGADDYKPVVGANAWATTFMSLNEDGEVQMFYNYNPEEPRTPIIKISGKAANPIVAAGDEDLKTFDVYVGFNDNKFTYSLSNIILTFDLATSTIQTKVADANAVGYYNLMGVKLSQAPENGIYIIKYDNGTAAKVMK